MKSQLRTSEAAVFKYYVKIFQKYKYKYNFTYIYIYLQHILFIVGVFRIFRVWKCF